MMYLAGYGMFPLWLGTKDLLLSRFDEFELGSRLLMHWACSELQVDPEELHFLILHQLYQTCPAAATALEREATDRGLLPCRTDVFGTLVHSQCCLHAAPYHICGLAELALRDRH